MSEQEQVECWCGRAVSAYTPKGGDGSVLRPRKHNDPRGLPCPYRFRLYDRAAPVVARPAPQTEGDRDHETD